TLQDKISIQVNRKAEGFDVYAIGPFPQEYDPAKAAMVLAAFGRHFRSLDRPDAISKLLGEELAEFYRHREETVLRLERLNKDLIERNSEYRRKLDDEAAERNTRLQTEFDAA